MKFLVFGYSYNHRSGYNTQIKASYDAKPEGIDALIEYLKTLLEKTDVENISIGVIRDDESG